MAIQIGLSGGRDVDPWPDVRFHLHDDAIYWFCFPSLLALRDDTGEIIDLYGDAWFGGPTLDALRGQLTEIRLRAVTLPDEWDELIGYNKGSRLTPIDPPMPRFARGRRHDLLAILDAWLMYPIGCFSA